MNKITAPQLNLDQVKAEFDSWRKRRVRRERIPEHLWVAAIALLNHHPISTVQKQLNLNLKQLKQRSSTNEPLDKYSLSKQQFLEIKSAEIAAINGQSHSPTYTRQIADSTCRIAFERSDGSRLTISLPADCNIISAICANLLRE